MPGACKEADPFASARDRGFHEHNAAAAVQHQNTPVLGIETKTMDTLKKRDEKILQRNVPPLPHVLAR